MLSHGRACLCGLAAWGAGRPVGRAVRGACFRKGQHFRGLDSWNSGRLLLLLLAENYNRTTKDQTTESQSAQRLHD